MIKRFLSGILVAIMLIGSTSAAEGSSTWAQSEVTEAIELEMVPAELQSDYQQPITRAEFCRIALYFLAVQYNYRPQSVFEDGKVSDNLLPFLNDYAEYHKGPDGRSIDKASLSLNSTYGAYYRPEDWYGIFTALNQFTDIASVPNDYMVAVNAAYLFGIVQGKGNGVYDPDGHITRQEAATILARTYGVLSGNAEHTVSMDALAVFADADKIADWAKDGAAFVVSENVMPGTGNQQFSPEGTYTREQCILSFLRLYKNGEVSKVQGNITPLRPYQEELDEALGTGYNWSSVNVQFQQEVDLGTVIYGLVGGMPHGATGSFLVVVYKAGGHKFIYYPCDWLSDFTVDATDGRVYCTGKWYSSESEGQKYVIDLEKAKLMPV